MINRRSWKFRNLFYLPLLTLIGLLPTVAGSAEGTPVKVGANVSLALPAGWNIIESSQDVGPERVVENTDLNAFTLLLSARPADAARRVGISLFRSNMRCMGPPPSFPGMLAAQMETEKLLCMVLGLGFTPTAIQTSRSNSSQNTPLLTVEVTAKNATGEERVFTNTSTGSKWPTARLFSSRSAADQIAAQEIVSIIRSIGVSERPTMASPSPTPLASVTPSAGATPSATPAATTSPETAQFVTDHYDALLMVTGQKGVGSGFLCLMGGKTFAITNAHVLSGNPGFKLTNLKSTVLPVSGGGISVDHDIVKLGVGGNAGKCFELIENLDTAVKIGDPVIILGNVQGAMVVKPVEGKVVGIGPNLVEVDAPFLPGNSGSPIVHAPTGKVIGVATYYTERKVGKGGTDAKNGNEVVTVEIRRFGYRIDSVKIWEPLNWQRFYAQSAQVEKIDATSADFIRLSKDFSRSGSVDPNNYSTSSIQRAIRSLMTQVQQRSGRAIPQGERQMLLTQFYGELRTASRSDVNGFDLRTSYDYFRREVQSQMKFRDAIYQELSHSIDNKSF